MLWTICRKKRSPTCPALAVDAMAVLLVSPAATRADAARTRREDPVAGVSLALVEREVDFNSVTVD
jgi:hypothetical protein